MIRISTFGQTAKLLNTLNQHQIELNQTQNQIGSGKKSQTYDGLVGMIPTLSSAQSMKAQTQGMIDSNAKIRLAVNMRDNTIATIMSSIGAIKDTLMNSISLQNAQGLRQTIDAHFKSIAGALNIQLDNSYLFAGSLTSTKPFIPGDLNDLAALASADDSFANDQNAPVNLLDVQTLVRTGQLADEIVKPLMEVLRAYTLLDNASPMTGKLNQSEVDALLVIANDVEASRKHLQIHQSVNGILQKQMDEIEQKQSNFLDTLTILISDIEDTDMPSAITRLQQQQSAIEASYKILSRLPNLSLTNYI